MSDDSIRQEFLTELDAILESDEAYGSNIQVLTYSVKDEIVSGKFRDSWNNRVYEFIIDIDGISYKPAAKLDSFFENELPARFDAYSEGYGSLLPAVRLDRNPTGKRVKKPRCGAEGYGCGFSCIGLTKTCRILSAGKKTRGEFQGKAIGKERLTKLIVLSTKLAANGDKKKFAAVNAIGAQIINTRTKYTGAGQALIAERALGKQKQVEEQSKILTKSQEKQSTKSKPETTPKSKGLVVDQETFNIKLPPQEVARQYGIGGPVERAKAVIDFVKKPKTFTSLSVGDQAGFLDNATTVHGVGDKNWDEQLEKPMVANDPGRKLGAESSNVRAQGAKQIWDNLTPSQKSEIANELKQFKSKLAEKPMPGIISESDNFENRYVQQLATEIRKLIK